MFGQNKTGQARQEDRDTINPFYLETGGWIATVATGESDRQDSSDCLPVGSEPTEEVGEAAVDRPEHANMFCFRTEWYFFCINRYTCCEFIII